MYVCLHSRIFQFYIIQHSNFIIKFILFYFISTQYIYIMSQQIQDLHKQIHILNLEREKNTLHQQNLQQQINILLSDNQILHKELNNLIESRGSDNLKQSSANQDSNEQSKSEESDQEQLNQYHYDDNLKNEKGNYHNFRKQKSNIKRQKQQQNQEFQYTSSVPERIYQQKISELEKQVALFKKQNQKLCEVNDKIINNFTQLKESFQEFQQKQTKQIDSKELEKQVEDLTQELQSVININHNLNQKYNRLKHHLNKQQQESWESNAQISNLDENSQIEKKQKNTQRFNHFHLNEVPKQRYFSHQNPYIKNQQHPIKFQDHSRSEQNYNFENGLERQFMTFNKFYDKDRKNLVPNKFKDSKQQSVSEVETLIHLANRLENELRTSENIYCQLVNSRGQAVKPRSVHNITGSPNQTINNFNNNGRHYSTVPMREEDYYRWISYQDRIKYLSNENMQLRAWEGRLHR